MTGFESVPVAPGPWLQIYRGAMRGGRAELLRWLDLARELLLLRAIAGVVLHGFPQELERNAAGLANECRLRGLPYAFSWGLDGTRDNDGTALTPTEKGQCMGRVLALHPDAWGLLDAEGRWDTDGGDGMHERGALEMGRALRALAPRATLGDQPWPMPDQHGGPRKVPRALDEGGPWAGYPLDEFAECVDFRAPQLYWTNWSGSDRYRRIAAWSEREWATADATLGPAGLVRPRTVTVQGYGHEPDPWALADCLLARRDRPTVVWVNPSRDASLVYRVLRAIASLDRLGYLVAGRSHTDSVRAWQRAAGLTADGLLGYAGLAKMEPQRKGAA